LLDLPTTTPSFVGSFEPALARYTWEARECDGQCGETPAHGDVQGARLEVLRGAVVERHRARRVLRGEVRARVRHEDLLLPDVAGRRRVREHLRRRRGGRDVLEREDLVRVARLAGQQLERLLVAGRDVVAVVEARRPARHGEALVGCIVEAAHS
jgi:hypothetical protein